ncbi:DUF6266 family protein [Sphingobacterium thalpophilum]|uniref:DUF6266 family protein n=1 Tax=Sphingobacterium thalpophilum TaxID=259 RepID=UPI0037D9F138
MKDMLVISDFAKRDKDPTRMKAVQGRFRLARKFLNPLYPLIIKGYAGRRRTVQAAFGRAMSHTLNNVVRGDFPDFWLDPSLARISNGMLFPLEVDKVSRYGDRIELGWKAACSNIREYSQWDDQVILCAYDIVSGQAAINEDVVLRQDGQLKIDLPSILHGRPVHLYLLLHDREEKLYSTSQYLGLLS